MFTSDEELIYLLREKNQDAIDLLLLRYYEYIKWFLKDIFVSKNYYFDMEDLYLLSKIKMNDIIDKYDEESGKFYSFARISIKRNVFDYLKKERSKKVDYSLDTYIDESNSIAFIDVLFEEGDSYSTYNIFNLKQVKEKIQILLSEEEKNILKDKIDGYSYKEIAKKNNKSNKYIDNKLSKIKNKLKDISK